MTLWEVCVPEVEFGHRKQNLQTVEKVVMVMALMIGIMEIMVSYD